MKTDWNKRFVELSIYISNWSKDRSNGVGAIIADSDNRILSIGYNGFPSGCDDDDEEKHLRPAKYLYTEHAERNAIYSAARNGVKLDGCIIYLSWFPCADCARAIIQCGITKMVCIEPYMDNKTFGDSFIAAKKMFEEVKMDIEYITL